MEIVFLSIIVIILILLFIKINLSHNDINILMEKIEDVENSQKQIIKELEIITKNVLNLTDRINNVHSNVNVNHLDIGKLNQSICNNSMKINNSITEAINKIILANEQLSSKLAATITSKPKTNRNTNKAKKVENQPENGK